MTPPGCAVTTAGHIQKNVRVIAATDSAGSQVIIGGHKYPIHYMSPDCNDHADAEKQAAEIVRTGEIPEGYTNMKQEKEGTSRSMELLTRSFLKNR